MTDITYSEIFYSPQGEGLYTGVPTLWIRFHLCNLQCDGFGQDDPTDPESYDLPYKDFDPDKIDRVEDLPVFERGCDSSYTWAKKFKHLMHTADDERVVKRLRQQMTNEFNPDGKFGPRHMCFTGGEPLLKKSQRGIAAIIDRFMEQDDIPPSITFETNGTQKLTELLIESLRRYRDHGGEVFMSVSPKLFMVSGEKESKALKQDVIDQLIRFSDNHQLKFVLDDKPATWEYFDQLMDQWEKSLTLPFFDRTKVHIMPVGATDDSQYNIAGAISDMAIARGYNVAARVHTYLYGNQIGT